MAFPPGFLDELRARISLSDVVGRKVALKRRSGAEYAGLCPFHNEKTPSFTVNDKKGFFHCFGCGEHGDAVGFVMKTEGLSFPESVEKLAREVNLPVPRATPQERERAERASTLQEVVEQAARWFQKQLRLPVGRHGLDYLRGRGLSDQTIDDFRLGFAPDSRDGLLAALKREGATIEKLVEAGLVIQPDDRGREPYDRFRGRVTFTINDRRGRAIAFGGRVMGQGEPKYLNSPETPLFHKGANLYCLDRARVAATKDQPVIVAEGYMDVIALHGAGFTGAVAPLGTALTEGQLGEMWKLADEPFLCFDGDNAGRRAAQRAAERALPLLRPGKSLRFVSLPAGDDPDSLIRARGPDAIHRVLQLARPLADVLWDMETDGKPADTPERRASIRTALMAKAAEIGDGTVRSAYRDEFTQRFDKAFGRRPPASGGRWQGNRRPFRGMGLEPPAPFAPGTAARMAGSDLDSSRSERVLLGALIDRPPLLHVVADELRHLEIENPELRRLESALLDFLAEAPSIDPAAEEALGGEPLEERLLAEHLQRCGLDRVAQMARVKARELFREKENEAWIDRWRRIAGHLVKRKAAAAQLSEAKQAFAADGSEENLRDLEAALRQHKEVAASETG
ncbi:MAG: DNA primase [Reyranella sp.]|uniref:DNA primase n=1 Tax=Reyranella sp. TaxID=1929291 RepID=UPI001AC23337|nr:DNA primase [Reyranella sp.]MBN9088233.1 DNA primase [Reyranella sp.]